VPHRNLTYWPLSLRIVVKTPEAREELLRARCKEPAWRARASELTNAVKHLTLINGLFELHHRESEFLLSRIHDFVLGSTLQFNRPACNDVCMSLLTVVPYQEPPPVCGRRVVSNSNRRSPVDVKAGKTSSIIR
jgi:hypothetical protein